MLFCRSREGVRVELALRLAPGIHGYGPNGVKIGWILPRLFKFSETVKKNDVFLHRFPRLFCRYREGVRVELALRLAHGIHGYGPNGVKIGLILPRLFEFSETG